MVMSRRVHINILVAWLYILQYHYYSKIYLFIFLPKLYSSTEHDETSPGLAEDPSTSPDQIWKKLGGVSLNQKNRSALLKPGSWLNDLIFDACQFLLKKKFPHYGGFQNPLLGSVLHF